MKEQNAGNHARYVPLYHIIGLLVLVATLVGAIMNVVRSTPDNMLQAWVILGLALVLTILYFMARTFALKAQDRAIRAEESFRHFHLTGRPHDSRLTISQLIALRFASDSEFEALAKRAADENLSNKQIKQAISSWRADHHRA